MSAEDMDNSSRPSIGSTRKRGSVRDSMSDFFKNARQSFVRSRGDRGATVKTLRGTKGADFEGSGMIHRGVEGGCCGGWFLNSDPLVNRYLVVKGPFCFVFVKEDSSSPQYAIKLHGITVDKPQHSHQKWSVVLRSVAMGEVQYELFFTEEEVAKKFETVATQQAAVAATEETRKKLGHAHLLTKRASVRYAETVATTKEKDQPEKPVSRDEILNNMEMQEMGMGI